MDEDHVRCIKCDKEIDLYEEAAYPIQMVKRTVYLCRNCVDLTED